LFEQNLVLRDLVCRDCNQYFGNTIDLVLARGSIEALDRLRHGLKPGSEATDLRRDRVQLTWAGSGEWHGVIMQFAVDPEGLAVQLIPQVRFARRDERAYVFIPLELLEDPNYQVTPETNTSGGMLLLVDSDATQERLIAALKARGVDFNKKNDVALPIQPGQQLPMEITVTIDSQLKRCIAKISFNYLASTEWRDLVLHQDLTATRRFIRYGERAPFTVVRMGSKPILLGDSDNWRQTNGHILTVNWPANSHEVIGQVSLFNQARYLVCLSPNLHAVWRDIRSGHLFDIERREITRLGNVAGLVLPRQ